MIIRTSQDADLVSCCGCELPECGEPRKECQNLTVSGYFGGHLDENLPYDEMFDTQYKKMRLAWSGEDAHWTEYEYNTLIEVRIGGKLVTDERVLTVTQGGGDTYNHPITKTLSGGMTFAEAVAELEQIATTSMTWDDEEMQKGAACSPSRSVGNVGGGTTTHRPPDLAITFVRYRMGIPEGFSTEENPRSVYHAQWDEVFFPTEWEEWKRLKDYYDQAVADHTAWEECEAQYPGWCGDEPIVPPDPGQAPEEGPELLNSRSWQWSGDTANSWSEWFEFPIPEGQGDTRLVNLMTKCHRDSKRGVKPTAHGEIYPLPE